MVTFAAGVIVFLGVTLVKKEHGKPLYITTATALTCYAGAYFFIPVNIWVSNLLVLTVAILVSILIGKSIASNGAVVAFCITATIVDFLFFQET